MTRTLGDFAAKKIGLISTPEIQHIELTTNDEFIVMASDGVWNVMRSAEAVGFIKSHLHLTKQCPDRPHLIAEMLAKTCKQRWQNRYHNHQ